MEDQEFYIGWMQKAPDSFAKHIRKVVLLLLILVIVTGMILALQQRKFSNSVFEYGQLTEVTGTYIQTPVPAIKVKSKPDMFGNSAFITIPLVGYGKHGAETVIDVIEMQKGIKLHQREVTLKGSLIYNDGKTLLQIDEHDNPLIKVSEKETALNIEKKELGTVELIGEILDPKCYFGVMKPGRGKPHRDCAIRCIAGGMSPVFYVWHENGEAAYYLLLDENGNRLNEKVQDYVAEPIRLKARAVQYDDWTVLYVDTKEKFQRTGGLSWFKRNDDVMYCKPQ